MSTSSLIWPSYTIGATIFEKVFQPEKFPITEFYCPYFLPPLLGGQAAIKSKAGAIKCCKEIKITAPPNIRNGVTFHYITNISTPGCRTRIWDTFPNQQSTGSAEDFHHPQATSARNLYYWVKHKEVGLIKLYLFSFL